MNFTEIKEMLTPDLVEKFHHYSDKFIKENEPDLEDFEVMDRVCNSDEMYVVVHFKESDIYVRVSGEYDSYGSGNHDYMSYANQVFPKEKTITVYEV